MRVLTIINSMKAGGTEKLVDWILPIQKSMGIDISLLLLSDKDNTFFESLKRNGVKIYSINKGIYNLFNIWIIKEYLKKNYDIIHVHLFPAQYWVVLASLFLSDKPKLITTEHSTHNTRRNLFLCKPIEKFIYRKFDRVISITQQTQKNLLEWIGEKNCKSTVIENGIPLDEFMKILPYKDKNHILNKKAHKGFIKDKDVLLMMVARFTTAKDHETLVRSLKLLPKNYKLLLVGEGKSKRKVIQLARKMKNDNRILFLGFRNDVPKLVKTVDVNILSSHWEGLPIVALEGMAAGKPFIGSEVNGIKEVVKGAGVLFKAGNETDLAKKILKLMENKKYYDEVSEKCRKRAQRYDIRNMASQYLDLYKKTIVDEKNSTHNH